MRSRGFFFFFPFSPALVSMRPSLACYLLTGRRFWTPPVSVRRPAFVSAMVHFQHRVSHVVIPHFPAWTGIAFLLTNAFKYQARDEKKIVTVSFVMEKQVVSWQCVACSKCVLCAAVWLWRGRVCFIYTFYIFILLFICLFTYLDIGRDKNIS